MRFHFGRNEIFSIRCLVSDQFLKIVYMYNPKWNSLRVLFYCGHFDRNENFISGDKILCKHYPKWNHMKGNICTCVNKNEWLLLNGPFISDQPRNKIRFISPVMKSNVNRISFMVSWNFGSHVNTLLLNDYCTKVLYSKDIF